MTATLAGVAWTVERVVRVVDGDSLRIVRSRPLELDGRRYRITDDDPGGVLVRLAWVDTPERGDPAWHDARLDLATWCNNRPAGLHVVVYGSSGWDRLLVDLRDADGSSASQWLMADRGWPPYTGGKA